MPKEQTGTSANSLASQRIRASFYHQPRDLCQQTDLPTNLAQSCKPAAVGMFAYSGRVYICFNSMGSLQSRGQVQKNIWPITNMHVQQTTVYVCKKKYPCWGDYNLWSTFRAGVIITFSKEDINKSAWDITSKSHA